MTEKSLKSLTVAGLITAILIMIALIFYQAITASNIEPKVMEYESELFNGEIFTVDIIADDETWDHILSTAMEEEYTAVDVVVNGTLFRNVGLRPKGNSSLMFVASDQNTDRFSFKIKFDEYIDGQTCFGLDVLVLNNGHEDYSYLREFVSYELMHELGVDAALYNYSEVTLNGQPWGLYLALETYNESFQQRNYGDSNGHLYSAKFADITEGGAKQPARGRESLGNGLDLQYIGDNPDDYVNFFDNSVGAKDDRTDHLRLIEAIEVLNNYESLDQLEQYWDMDQVIAYMAAHTVSVNGDSYTTTMCQNYFLYEKDGKVSILPWDYSSTFGSFFISTQAFPTVNFPVHTPVHGVELDARPLFNVVLSTPAYKEQYDANLLILADYLKNIDTRIEEIDNLINEYVKNDATAFCTFEQFEAARDALSDLLILRGESVAGQVEGTIPSTTEGQMQEPEKLIDTSEIDQTALMNRTGGPAGGPGGGPPNGGGMSGGRPTGDRMNGQQMTGQIPGQQMSGQIPGQQMSGQIPGQQMTGQIPGQQMSGQIPGQQMSGQMPGQQMSGQMPGQQMTGQIPGQMTGEQMPGQMTGEQMPGQMTGEQMPGQMSGQQMPGQMTGEQMPGQMSGQQRPGQMNGQQIPGQMSGQQMPGQMNGQQMPGQMTGGQIPGQQMPGGMPGGIPGGLPGFPDMETLMNMDVDEIKAMAAEMGIDVSDEMIEQMMRMISGGGQQVNYIDIAINAIQMIGLILITVLATILLKKVKR